MTLDKREKHTHEESEAEVITAAGSEPPTEGITTFPGVPHNHWNI